MPASDHYDRVARDRALEQIETARRRITTAILAQPPKGRKQIRGRNAVDTWLAQGPDAARTHALRGEIAGGDCLWRA